MLTLAPAVKHCHVELDYLCSLVGEASTYPRKEAPHV